MRTACAVRVVRLRAHMCLRNFSSGAPRGLPVSALNYCVELVQHQDRERYLCNLHAPESARAGLFALHAFNCETARIRAGTSEQLAAAGRINWWREALAGAARGQPPEHPVAQALAHAHERYGLTARFLMQLLEAREADLRVQQPRDLEQLRKYCEATAGSLLLLGLECAGVAGNEAAEHAASQAGIALGIATLLRGTAAHAAHGCTYLPAEVTTRHGVQLSRMLRGRESAELCSAVAEVADEAVAHLLAARSLRRDVPATATAVLLPATIADHLLRSIQAQGFSPFGPGAGAPLGLRFQLALWWHKTTGQY